MAARLRRQHQDEVRAKIQASQLVNRLMGHATGEVEMSASQVQAAKILLDKVVSNAPTEIAGEDGDAININVAGSKERLARRIASLASGKSADSGDSVTH